jgi:RHS repeat-associated protein
VPIESYEYSPYGERLVRVNDHSPPAVEQVRVVGDALWIELSEPGLLARLESAAGTGEVALIDTATSQPVPLSLDRPVGTGPRADHRLVLTPSPVPAAGAEVRLEIAAGLLADVFGNAGAGAVTETFNWSPGVVTDTAPPRIVAVASEVGRLRLTFSEEPDLGAAATAIQIDGQPASWTLDADGYTLESASTLGAGAHSLTVGTGLVDLAGTALAEPFTQAFSLSPTVPDELVYLAPAPDLLTVSAAGNAFGFHGLPHDDATGLVYARNRWYDPGLGQFTSTDSLGYVDGPNLYGYAGNNPVNYSDPLGLCMGLKSFPGPCSRYFDQAAEEIGNAFVATMQLFWGDPPESMAEYSEELDRIVGRGVGSIVASPMTLGDAAGTYYATWEELLFSPPQTQERQDELHWRLYFSETGTVAEAFAVAGAVGGTRSLAQGLIRRVEGQTAKGLHEEAVAARDALATDLAQQSHPPATVVGAYSPSSGGVAAGASRGGGLGCAEGVCAEILGDPTDIQFTPAVRPRTGEVIPVCPSCEATYGRGAFPDPATPFATDSGAH